MQEIRLTRLGDLLPFLLCSAVELPFPGFRLHGMARWPLQQLWQKEKDLVGQTIFAEIPPYPETSQSIDEMEF